MSSPSDAIEHNARLPIGRLLVAAAALLVAAILLLWRDRVASAEFGWFAYAPLSEGAMFFPGPTGWAVGGYTCLGVALACLFTALGMLWARRILTGRQRG